MTKTQYTYDVFNPGTEDLIFYFHKLNNRLYVKFSWLPDYIQTWIETILPGDYIGFEQDAIIVGVAEILEKYDESTGFRIYDIPKSLTLNQQYSLVYTRKCYQNQSESTEDLVEKFKGLSADQKRLIREAIEAAHIAHSHEFNYSSR